MRSALLALPFAPLLAVTPLYAAPDEAAETGCFREALVRPGASVADALRSATSGHRVLGFGESVHGGDEFHRLPFDFALELARNEPVELALEIDVTHAAALDRWVQGADDPSLAGLFADRWWSSEIFYDEALRSFLVAAHALDRQRPGSLRFAGFDLKQPDLAAAEIVATVARTDPARAATIRSLADRILALGGFGVFPNVAGFSATLELALPPPDAGATVALVVPLAGTGGSYGEAGVVVSPTGGDWSTRRVQSLPVTMLRNEATLLPLPIPEGPGTIELTLFHRGDGEVRFGWPRPVASDGAATPESWEHLAPAPLAMPLLQKQDYRHRFEHRDDGSSELVVAPDPAVAAARADLARIGQLLASPGAARLADAERRTVERAFRSLSQALAWRTLEEPNRDRLLADNVLALAAEAGPARRLLLLGHASHIERIENRMGGWLSSALGERYGSVTLAAAAGSYKYFGDPRTTPAGAPLVDFPLPADPWFDWIPREVTAPFVLDTARARRCAGDALNRAGVRPERTDLLVVLPRLRPIESARTGAP